MTFVSIVKRAESYETLELPRVLEAQLAFLRPSALREAK